jgi:hypothetical protein
MTVPITTAKLAQRMLCTSRTIVDSLPRGLYGSPGLDILLALHIAEEDAQYLSANELTPPGSLNTVVTDRWDKTLEQYDLIDRAGDLLALSSHGHAVVSGMLEAIYLLQRTLD